MIEQAFEVATEFRFDVGQAILNTDSLRKSVDELSSSADSALNSLHYLAGGLVARLGFGSGGLLSMFVKAAEVSEAFNISSMGFVNAISSNMRVLSGHVHGFNEQLETSNMLMTSVRDKAGGLGLDAGQMAQLTQTFATPLASRKRLGTNFAGGIELAKNTMIASEITGMHPMAVQEQLLRALNPGQGFGGKLFERLINTEAFRGAHIYHPNRGASMNVDKKMDLVIRAMGELGNNAEYLAARMNNIKVIFATLKNHIEDFLKPIGDAILVPMRKIFNTFNDFLQKNGKQIGENLGKLIASFLKDPKEALVSLLQLRSFGADFKKALHLTEVLQVFMFLRWILGKIGIEFNGTLLRAGLSMLWNGLKAAAMFIWDMGIIGKVFSLLGRAMMAILPEFLIFLGVFQTISRAIAIAKIDNIRDLAELTPRLSAVMVRLKEAFATMFMPITMVMNAIAEFLAPLFKTSTYAKAGVWGLEKLATLMEFFAKVSLLASAAFQGLVFVIAGFINDITHGKGPFKNISTNWNAGVDDYLSRNAARLGKTPDAASKVSVYNTNNINARFDMREQMEPDRIAYSVTEHLKKLAINPRQSVGQSLYTGFANPRLAGAN